MATRSSSSTSSTATPGRQQGAQQPQDVPARRRRPVEVRGRAPLQRFVSEGRLAEEYPEFVKSVLLAAVPEPGLWTHAPDSRVDHRDPDLHASEQPDR